MTFQRIFHFFVVVHAVTKVDPNCPDFDLYEECADVCLVDFALCLQNCGSDPYCHSNCSRDEISCLTDCPCESNCPNGCDGCENHICTPKKSVLTIDFSGNVNDDLRFEYEDGTDVYQSCAVTFLGEFWIFGGESGKKRQVSKVNKNQCKLQLQPDKVMPFDLFKGACNTFMFFVEVVVLCFDYNSPRECHIFDGWNFKDKSDTSFPHLLTMSLASYQGKPLITGSDKTNDDPKNAKTEIYDYQSDSWSDAPDYPYSARITYYATTSTSDSTYIIGGQRDNSDETGTISDIIAQFKDFEWSIAGRLKKGRWGHAAITYGPNTMIIGGNLISPSTNPAVTELWNLESGTGRIIDPELEANKYAYGIGLFLVNPEFCQK